MTDTMPSEQTSPPLKALLLRLRKSAKLTQQALADASGLTRLEVLALERGKNKGTSHRVHLGLARAYGVTVETFDAYLDGEIDLPSIIEARQPIERAA